MNDQVLTQEQQLAKDEEEFLPVGKKEFQVTDWESADWVASKIVESYEADKRAKNRYELRKENARQRAFFFWRFGDQLRAFYENQLVKGKSIKLDSLTIGVKSVTSSLVVIDAEAALAWTKKNLPSAVVESVDTTAIKQWIEDLDRGGGEVPPGFSYTARGEEFYVSAPREPTKK